MDVVKNNGLCLWSSQPGAPPRVAISWALADYDFEAPAFDIDVHGPYPPLKVYDSTYVK